jgi:glycosyltransferase involved in cell wall biosynthesis
VILGVGRADALISFGGPTPTAMLRAIARTRKIPIFIIWAGTDVMRVLARPSAVSQAQRAEFIHLAVAPWLVDELRQAGISAQYMPIVGVNPAPGTEIAKDRFEVLSYLPEPLRDFYGRRHVYEVASRMPDVNFLIIGAGAPDVLAPANVKFFGWLSDIAPLFDRCAMLLRVPDHDGMSLLVLEALSLGRFVAWKYPISGAQQVVTPDDTVNYINELRKRLAIDRTAYNREGIEFITNAYQEQRVSVDVERFIDERVARTKERVKSSRRVAVSGLDLFATDVADLNNHLPTLWRAEVLHYETRYDMIASLYNLVRSDVWYTVGTPIVSSSVRIAATLFKKVRVMHWVGTDIDVARRNPAILTSLRHQLVTHLTEVEWEAEELRTLGIDAKIAPLPLRFSPPRSMPSLPSEFTVLTYLPRSRTDFYGKRELEFVVRAFRGCPVRFLIVGGGTANVPLDAPVEDLGWRYSLDEIYARSSALLRFTPRDGLSLMVLEALAFGRHVLWTRTFPFVRHVLNVEGIVETLQELLNLNEAGKLEPQLDAAQFVRTTYDRERCLNGITSTWDVAFSKGRHRRRM